MVILNMFGKIYELARKIETSRPKKISICMLTNNLEKLNKIYGDDYLKKSKKTSNVLKLHHNIIIN